MIRSFRTSEDEALFRGLGSSRLPHELWRTAHRRLLQLDAAARLEELPRGRGVRPEPVGDGRTDRYRIRLDAQYGIRFAWRRGAAEEVEVVDDYRREDAAPAGRLSPVHPGEVLQEEFLKPMGLTNYRLAKAMNVPPQRIGQIVHGKLAITANTALRLGRALGTGPEFWMRLQARHDLDVEAETLGGKVEREVEPLVR